MILRSGCRTNYMGAAAFDASAGEEYWTTINAEDATGRDIDGGIREGTVTRSGRLILRVPLLLCGSLHDAGWGKIKVGLIVGDDTRVTLRKPVQFVYQDRVNMRKPAKRAGRKNFATLRGTWNRGYGFGAGLTTYVRKSVVVRLYFKPRGQKWRPVAATRIDGQGRWAKRVKVRKNGYWQARVLKTSRLLPAHSKSYPIRRR